MMYLWNTVGKSEKKEWRWKVECQLNTVNGKV